MPPCVLASSPVLGQACCDVQLNVLTWRPLCISGVLGRRPKHRQSHGGPHSQGCLQHGRLRFFSMTLNM